MIRLHPRRCTPRALLAVWLASAICGGVACGRLSFENNPLGDGGLVDSGGDPDARTSDSTVPSDSGGGPDAQGPGDSGNRLDSGNPPDATAGDSGNPLDATVTDTGIVIDSGNPLDATVTDTGTGIDSGNPVDATVADTGIDSGIPVDATVTDTGVVIDAGNPVDAGTDTGVVIDAGTGGNTRPLAVLLLDRSAGYYDTATPTGFSADASGSSDLEDPPNLLTYEWDWDNDGVFEPGDVGIQPPVHRYSAPGDYTVVLRVTDTGGLSGYAERLVIVRDNANLITVGNPGDPTTTAGMSPTLREAITMANSASGRQTIYIPSGFVIRLATTMLDSTDAAGLDIVGDGVTIDGGGLGGTRRCLDVVSSNNRHLGLEILGCSGDPYAVSGTNNLFARGHVHNNLAPVLMGGSNNTFGPDNLVAANAPTGLVAVGPNVITGSRFTQHTGNGVQLGSASDGTRVIGCTFDANSVGLRIDNGGSNNTILHNTMVGNFTAHLAIGNTVTGSVCRNNLLAFGDTWGMVVGPGVFATLGPNLYFMNGSLGDCNNCPGGLGAGSVVGSDPLLIDRATSDHRLRPDSPAIDRGVDTGFDVNGTAFGNNNYFGALPDLGAHESY